MKTTTLQDIDARLARIESVVDRLAGVLDQAPAAIAVAGDAIDEVLAGAGPSHEIDARMQRTVALLDTLTQTRTLTALEQIVTWTQHLPELPGVTAVMLDAVDETFASAGPSHIVDNRVQRTIGLLGKLTEPSTLTALEQIVTWTQQIPELPNITALMLDAFDEVMTAIRQHGVNLEQTFADLRRSGILQADNLNFLLEAAGALADAGKNADGNARIGFFGLLKATRDPDVQRALAFLIDVARRLGALIQTPPRRALTHQEI